ncbi:MAG: hypothetical protein HY562_04170 [Ignavibacteriales bacterium]|nr:hypothetical protein [Ignavibacteriales bacterium]
MKTKIVRSSLLMGLFGLCMGCEGLLDVQNPNNVVEDDVNKPIAATGVANGANGTVMRGIGYVYAPYETATDEVYWIGSRDAWNQLDRGGISDFNNEFSDAAWPFICTGRWMADKAVSLLEGFDAAGTLTDRTDLARSYLYAALVRIVVGETFSDFVMSDKTDASPPIGENNMTTVFDQAVTLLNKGLPVAQSGTSVTYLHLQRRILALRARAQHSKAVRQLMIPAKTTPANPWVSVPAAAADAKLALAAMAAGSGSSTDYKWRIDFFSVTLFNEMAWELVGRSELQIAPVPVDPIAGTADARMRADSADFKNTVAYADRYSPITLISGREMHLIIAEDSLAAGDSTNAMGRLNILRGMNSLVPVTAGNVNTAMKHERRANLFLQGRRLMDMYRFGVQDSKWATTSEAYTTPGTLLPVTIIERRANPFYPK